MTTQLSDMVVIDPVLEKKKIRVHATRLLRGRMDSDGDYRYELAVALHREGKRWPKGTYSVRGYDASGLMTANTFVSENKSLDAERRHLEASFYAKELELVEVLFEDHNVGEDADQWLDLEVRRDRRAEESMSLDVRSLRARSHPDFEYGNLTTVEVSGDIGTSFGLPLPDRLAVQLSVLDESGHVLNSGQYDLSVGPASSRAMNNVVKVYRHEEPEAVRVEFFAM